MGFFTRSKNETTAEVAAEFSGGPLAATGGVARSVTLVKSTAAATDRSTVAAAGSIDLTKRFDKAGVSLSKRGLTGIRAQAELYVDHSGSMGGDYASGLVQAIVERALGFALQVDIDGTIPVTAWDSKLHPTVDVTLQNYQGIVDSKIWRRNDMGGTKLVPALKHLLANAKTATAPIFAIIVTDDEPWDADESLKLVLELASYPVFIKFLTTVDTGFANMLDDDEGKLVGRRLLDNVDAQLVDNIRTLSDLQFADIMTEEFSGWIDEATAKGVLI